MLKLAWCIVLHVQQYSTQNIHVHAQHVLCALRKCGPLYVVKYSYLSLGKWWSPSSVPSNVVVCLPNYQPVLLSGPKELGQYHYILFYKGDAVSSLMPFTTENIFSEWRPSPSSTECTCTCTCSVSYTNVLSHALHKRITRPYYLCNLWSVYCVLSYMLLTYICHLALILLAGCGRRRQWQWQCGHNLREYWQPGDAVWLHHAGYSAGYGPGWPATQEQQKT